MDRFRGELDAAMIDRRKLLCLSSPDPDRMYPGPVALDLSRRLRTDPMTRRHFLKAGFSVGVILALSMFPSFPASAVSTTRLVSSVSGNNTTGLTWALAYTSVASGLAGSAAGDVLLVDSAHSFTATAAITWTPPTGGIAIICVTPSGAAGTTAPTPTTGAVEAVGAASAAFLINGAAASATYISGMTIKGGSNASASCTVGLLANASTPPVCYLNMLNCTIDLLSTSAVNVNLGPVPASGSSSQTVRMRRCTYNCTGSRTGFYFAIQNARVDIIAPTFSFGGASKPAELISTGGTGMCGSLTIRDGDASGFAGTAFVLLTTNFENATVVLKNLVKHATPTITTGTWPGGNSSVTVINSDSANTDYVLQYLNSYGTAIVSTSIYKNSGSLFNAEPVSIGIVTSSLCSEYQPFVLPFLNIWDTSTSAETPTLSVAQANGATNLNDRTAWLTIDAAHSATTTRYDFFTGGNTYPFVGSAVDWPADTGATWTGITTPNKQLLGLPATVTPARKGRLQPRLFIGAASVTVNVNAVVDGIS